MPDPAELKIVEWLRSAGLISTFFNVPPGGPIPPELQEEKQTVTIQVGRRQIEVNDSVSGGGGGIG